MNTKRRVLSFLMALVMVLGVMAVLPITIGAEATVTDVRTQLESYGFPSRNLTTFSTPNMDGVIDEDVYLTVNNAAGSNTNNATYAVTEYFAYDETRVYYAITLPDSVTSFYFNLFTLQDGVPNKSYFYRLQTQVTTTGVTYNGARNNDDGSAWQKAAAITQANIGFGYKNNADDTHTWELSYLISELCGASGSAGALVRNFRYYVDLGAYKLAYHLPEDLRTNDMEWNRSSFIGMNVNLSMENHDVDARDLSAFGHAPLNVGFSTKALDVTDGVIDTADYTATRQIKAVVLQTATKGEHVTEYMTHDDEFIYMAFKIAGHNMDHANGTQVSIWYTDSKVAADSGPYCETRFNFLPANKDGSGVIPATAHGWMIGTGAGYVKRPSSGPESFAASEFAGAAKMDTDGTTGIVEFKISKAALASRVGIDVVDFSNVRVKLNYRTTSGGNDNGWHTGLYCKQPTDMYALAVLDGAEDTGFSATNGGNTIANSYNFVNTAPQSADVGSIRIDTAETSGLRFQTTVGKAYLAELEAAGYTVEAGTIIAPEDAGLTMDADGVDGEAGVDYLDVVANLEYPYHNGVTTVTFTGAIVKINPGNLDRNFTAVGYLKLTKDANTEYVYSNAVTKNVSEVAQAAKDSGKYNEDPDALEILNALIAN